MSMDSLHDKCVKDILSDTAKKYRTENRKHQNINLKKLTPEEILAYRNARKGK